VAGLDVIIERLAAAGQLPEVLAAGWDAFEVLRKAADAFGGQVTEHYATWLSAVAPACEGRDALAQAPLMPQLPASPGALPELEGVAEADAARMTARLAAELRKRLVRASALSRDPADVTACLRGADAAAEIQGLFAGAE
jgi:hypothetical protein